MSGAQADVGTFDAHNYVWRGDIAPAHAAPDSAPTHAVVASSQATVITIPPASLTVVRFGPATEAAVP